MEQIKQAVTIMKNRWQEVALIFGLLVLSLFALALISPEFYAGRDIAAGEKIEFDGMMVLYGIFSLITAVVSFLLSVGFVRTAYLSGSEGKTAGELFTAGREFFWRLVGFFIFYYLALFILQLMGMTAANTYYRVEEISALDPTVIKIIGVVSRILLIKPAIFIPAVIVVLNCTVIQSFGYLREIKLSDSKELIVLFLLELLILWFLPFNEEGKETLFYILWILPKAVVHFISLLIFMIAARQVSSYNFQKTDNVGAFEIER